MMVLIWLLIIGGLAFSISIILTSQLIPFFERNNIIALDLNKKNNPKRANSGGIPVSLSLMMGVMAYIAVFTFFPSETTNDIAREMLYLFASVLTIFLITIIGFFDDLNRSEVVVGKRKIRKGLKKWQKPLFTIPAAIPLMAVSAGVTTMTIPFLGPINFGILYPLFLIPIGVIGTANAINLLGGFNGSETGMGIIYCATLGTYSLLHNELISATIFFSTVGALIGFMVFNWPGKILSGDSLTYCLGAIVASGVIIGNMEKAGIIVMTPFIIEFLLKFRSKFKASCLGKLRKDGKLDSPYGKKIYSWTHIIMNFGKLTEKQVSTILILIQIIFGLLIFI
jgi:UDP-N-acetylglucosamine--dolichyl-phosphate N-acetylglucosaminephosphotransferase